jgi:hypothetical protein
MDQIHLADVLHIQQHNAATDTVTALAVLLIKHHHVVPVTMFIHAAQYQFLILIHVVLEGIIVMNVVYILTHLLEAVAPLMVTHIKVALDVFHIMIAQYIHVQDMELAQVVIHMVHAQCTLV